MKMENSESDDVDDKNDNDREWPNLLGDDLQPEELCVRQTPCELDTLVFDPNLS